MYSLSSQPFLNTWCSTPKRNATSEPERWRTYMSAFAAVRVKRGSTTITLQPFSLACSVCSIDTGCESCVMPCSRTEAPLAQCAPRLSGESNTGSWRTHTPFCTTASIAQPTEQCVHTVRLTSSWPPSSFASARPMMLNGSCAATAAPPMPTPERLRNARRSIVAPSTPENPRDKCECTARDCDAALDVALRVNSMALSSDLRGAVVVVDVLA